MFSKNKKKKYGHSVTLRYLWTIYICRIMNSEGKEEFIINEAYRDFRKSFKAQKNDM